MARISALKANCKIYMYAEFFVHFTFVRCSILTFWDTLSKNQNLKSLILTLKFSKCYISFLDIFTLPVPRLIFAHLLACYTFKKWKRWGNMKARLPIGLIINYTFWLIFFPFKSIWWFHYKSLQTRNILFYSVWIF